MLYAWDIAKQVRGGLVGWWGCVCDSEFGALSVFVVCVVTLFFFFLFFFEGALSFSLLFDGLLFLRHVGGE